MLKIHKGRKYICTKTVTIKEEVAFIEGDIYVSLKDDHLIDINGVHRNLGIMQLECFELKTIDNHGYWEKLWHDYTIKIFCSSLQTPEIQKILIAPYDACSHEEKCNVTEQAENFAINAARHLVQKIMEQTEEDNKPLEITEQ